ncbi:hypothetical protein ACLOJK_011467 [Asimina triloba]
MHCFEIQDSSNLLLIPILPLPTRLPPKKEEHMSLRGLEATLPPGFRFYPSDEELVCHYLYKKVANENISQGTLVEIDLHTCEPWQLPVYSAIIAVTLMKNFPTSHHSPSFECDVLPARQACHTKNSSAPKLLASSVSSIPSRKFASDAKLGGFVT